MTPETLNTLGLISNILGVILIFFYGLPQPSHDAREFLELVDNTIEEKNIEIRKRKARYKFFAYFALILLLTGFALQFLAIHADLLPFH